MIKSEEIETNKVSINDKPIVGGGYSGKGLNPYLKDYLRNNEHDYKIYEEIKNKQFEIINKVLLDQITEMGNKIYIEVGIFDECYIPCIFDTLFQTLIMYLTDCGRSNDDLCDEVKNWSLHDLMLNSCLLSEVKLPRKTLII